MVFTDAWGSSELPANEVERVQARAAEQFPDADKVEPVLRFGELLVEVWAGANAKVVRV